MDLTGWPSLFGLVLAFCLPWAAGSDPAADPYEHHAFHPSTAKVVSLVDEGRFSEAETRIAAALAGPDVDPGQRRALQFERERMRRILLDFTLDETALRVAVARQIPDLRDEEFVRWRDAGLFESQSIDGNRLYFKRAPSNLYRLSAEAAARRAQPRPFNDSPFEVPHVHHLEVRKAAQ